MNNYFKKKKNLSFLFFLPLLLIPSFGKQYDKFSCYVVNVEEFRNNPKQTVNFVNKLIRLDYPVYRSAEIKNVGETRLKPGDFIIRFNNKKQFLYLHCLQGKYGKGKYLNLPFDLKAYPLKKGRIAVFDGVYAQHCADNHLSTLTDMNFDAELLGDVDLFDGKLRYPEYIAFILPGLGSRESGLLWYSPGQKGKEEIQKFVRQGGGVFGTCAGAWLIMQKCEFNDETITNNLDLAAISHTVTFRGRGLIKQRAILKDSPLFYGLGEFFYMYHSGGGGMRALNDTAKAAAVYVDLSRYTARPWARTHFDWDKKGGVFRGDKPEETEEGARQWLLPYLNNTRFSSAIVAVNDKGRVVAIGDHPEHLAQMKEGKIKWHKDGEEFFLTREDMNNGYIYEANIIYFITQEPGQKIKFEPIEVDREFLTTSSFNFKGNQSKSVTELLKLIGKIEGEIDILDSAINEIETVNKKLKITISWWDKVLGIFNRLKNEISALSDNLIAIQYYGIEMEEKETCRIKEKLTVLEKQFKEAKKELFFIKNAMLSLDYISQQRNKVKGQHGLKFSAEEREESWSVGEEYLKIYLTDVVPVKDIGHDYHLLHNYRLHEYEDVVPLNKNVAYVYGSVTKSPGFTLNMVLRDIRRVVNRVQQDMAELILVYSKENLVPELIKDFAN